jgi:hypothetical protein
MGDECNAALPVWEGGIHVKQEQIRVGVVVRVGSTSVRPMIFLTLTSIFFKFARLLSPQMLYFPFKSGTQHGVVGGRRRRRRRRSHRTCCRGSSLKVLAQGRLDQCRPRLWAR